MRQILKVAREQLETDGFASERVTSPEVVELRAGVFLGVVIMTRAAMLPYWKSWRC